MQKENTENRTLPWGSGQRKGIWENACKRHLDSLYQTGVALYHTFHSPVSPGHVARGHRLRLQLHRHNIISRKQPASQKISINPFSFPEWGISWLPRAVTSWKNHKENNISDIHSAFGFLIHLSSPAAVMKSVGVQLLTSSSLQGQAALIQAPEEGGRDNPPRK